MWEKFVLARQDVFPESETIRFRPNVGLVRASYQLRAAAEPTAERWSGASRVGIAVGLAVASWIVFVISIGFVGSVLASILRWI